MIRMTLIVWAMLFAAISFLDIHSTYLCETSQATDSAVFESNLPAAYFIEKFGLFSGLIVVGGFYRIFVFAISCFIFLLLVKLINAMPKRSARVFSYCAIAVGALVYLLKGIEIIIHNYSLAMGNLS